MEPCRVAVGSRNPVKVNTVKLAFRILCTPEVVGVEVESGVPPQPVGLCEITLGAINRAVNALHAASADYGVGIEAGIAEETPVEPFELQVAAVVDKQGRLSIGMSPGFPLPRSWLDELRKGVELGAIAERATGRREIGKKLGLIGYLTYGMVTRTDLSRDALVMALVPRLNPHLYTSLPTVEEAVKRLRGELNRL